MNLGVSNRITVSDADLDDTVEVPTLTPEELRAELERIDPRMWEVDKTLIGDTNDGS